jgi:hypothetical protein
VAKPSTFLGDSPAVLGVSGPIDEIFAEPGFERGAVRHWIIAQIAAD